MEHFKQIRELVQWAADYHARLAVSYSEKASNGTPGERQHMALKYVADYQRSLQTELQKYLADESDHRGVLDTWFEEAVDAPTVPELDSTVEAADAASVQKVLSATLASQRPLQELYKQRAEHAVSGSERELFESLIGQYDAEVRRFSRNMQRLEDY